MGSWHCKSEPSRTRLGVQSQKLTEVVVRLRSSQQRSVRTRADTRSAADREASMPQCRTRARPCLLPRHLGTASVRPVRHTLRARLTSHFASGQAEACTVVRPVSSRRIARACSHQRHGACLIIRAANSIRCTARRTML